jgi:hypothetical protein
MSSVPIALLLGVFYSKKFDISNTEPDRGQLFRDGVRSKALEDAGYVVRTLDNKHIETDVELGAEIHCDTSFTDSRKMLKAVWKTFGRDVIFDLVILDYFFSPVSVSEGQ